MTAKHQALFLLALSAFAATACTSGGASPSEDATQAEVNAAEAKGSGAGEKKDCTGVPTPMCAAGTKLVDTNGDGCVDGCEAVACPPFIPTCAPGEVVADVDGDGCALECAACPAILCDSGTKELDSNGDGCFDKCEPVSCPPFVPTCEPGEHAADLDGDGCALECAACPAILCQAGTKQIDSNGDGCFDKCEPVVCPPVIPSCPPGEKPTDTNGDGCALECAP